MTVRVTVRDRELLRTVLRVRLASTGLLAGVFFTQRRLARRRLQTLRERDLLAVHSKGLPPSLSGQRYWRLTARGLEVVARSFPSEPMPDNVIVRTASASLRQFEHRDAIAQLYTELVRDPKGDLDELARRAEAIGWRAEYDVVLRYQDVDGAEYVERSIVPDATVELDGVRVFVELDRSTESHARVRRAVAAYGRYLSSAYGEDFGDGRRARVLYVTRSAARARNLARVVRRAAPDQDVEVATAARAPQRLAELAFGVDPPAVRTVSADVELVRELYELARRGVELRIAAGEIDDTEAVPSCLHDAYALLAPHGH